MDIQTYESHTGIWSLGRGSLPRPIETISDRKGLLGAYLGLLGAVKPYYGAQDPLAKCFGNIGKTDRWIKQRSGSQKDR